ncbi:MAG TPA: hypothetical protein VKX28_24130 [Xanthobacteraceae bacterium]|nr:hypothetical protein [Xanthobacteraceae bacterium]
MSSIEASPGFLARPRAIAIDRERAAGWAVLAVALVVGLATAADYGVTIDEFNANDYGPKALAWYTSGFVDRSQFTSVEDTLWYYGPWFQMLTAAVQSLALANPLTIRHALSFVIGLAGLAALLPMARLSFGRWVGPAALVICLLTGYLYGNLFFAPIDTPFLAAMCWATLAIMAMGRTVVPTWPATLAAGAAIGLALGTRTGGIIAPVYLLGVMALCACEAVVSARSAAPRMLLQIALRTAAALALAAVVAIAIWPWLQIGNPLTQFKIAYAHFAAMTTEFAFAHWGHSVVTTHLPRTYIPAQWLARLPIGFLALLAVAVALGLAAALKWLRPGLAGWWRGEWTDVSGPLLSLARSRNALLVWVAVVAPIGYLMFNRTTLYDGVRHTLFVIPMLALLAGWASVRIASVLGRIRLPAAVLAAVYVVALCINLAVLHPLEYIATNAFAGGTAGSYGRFDLDYWSAAATEALRQLEARLDRTDAFARGTPGILICIPYRDYMSSIMLDPKWRVETDIDKADFVIESERWRCAADKPNLVPIDEVKRYDRPFAWTFVNKNSPYASAVTAP